MWQKTTYEKLVDGQLALQEIGDLGSDEKNALLDSMSTGVSYSVTDNRDGQPYTIAKLLDGRLWMVNNLNLGATALTTDLTSENTNLSDTISATTFNTWIKTTGSNSYTSAELIPENGTDSTSGTPYGTLYNYCAASAGTICTDTNSSDASYDLCPRGWRLPIGGYSGEFAPVVTAYKVAKIRLSIADGGAAFALAGQFTAAVPSGSDINGYYWSSTRMNDTNMWEMSLGRSSISQYAANYRYYGHSIRCILK